jgi:putative aminopeptidase FrvX
MLRARAKFLARAKLLAAAKLLARVPGCLVARVLDGRLACTCHAEILEHLEQSVLAKVYAASRVPTLITCP